MAELLEEEEERRNTPPENIWTDEDEKQLPSAVVERQKERSSENGSAN